VLGHGGTEIGENRLHHLAIEFHGKLHRDPELECLGGLLVGDTDEVDTGYHSFHYTNKVTHTVLVVGVLFDNVLCCLLVR
jgi:hypothetical protein